MRALGRLAALAAVVGLAAPGWAGSESVSSAEPRHAVVVSVDGLMPAYYLRADELGLKIPNLRRLMRLGAYGRVTGVLPSVTYPSHTTLITGVPPRMHGIVSNRLFDPEGRSNEAWSWYASGVKVETLVSAARAKGLRTASVSWPVTVGLAADFNLPEFWRSGSEHPSDLALIEALSTPGLIAEVAKDRGRPFPYPPQDEDRLEVALHLLRRQRPNLLLLHIFDLDHQEHEYGPLTPQALQAVERADAAIGRLWGAVEAQGIADRTLFAVVSDHGFLPVRQGLRPNVRLREAGLVTLDAKGQASDWRAWFHASGGTAALRLKELADTATLDKVRALFAADAGRPGSGIHRILERTDIERLGGDAEAALVLDAEAGFSFSSEADGTFLAKPDYAGTHGHDPDRPELQSAVLMIGPGVSPADLGLVRMTSIAPTIARFLGLELDPRAGPSLPLW
jgi:predicted AlkP superfamily pyrophosphatase or phosphodiesterase